jgi:acyl-CoA thioester hydrolase
MPIDGSGSDRQHCFDLRVYYEDTDFSGVVYHASYLRFLERGRTEFLRSIGVDHRALFSSDPPLALVVRRMSLSFDRAAVMDDQVTVLTELKTIGGASMVLAQQIERDAEPLVSAEVTIACVAAGKPMRLPPRLRSALVAWLPGAH